MSTTTKTPGKVTVIRHAAVELGTTERRVREALVALEIPTHRVPHSPSGRGIDAAGMSKLKRHFQAAQASRIN